MGFFGGSWIPLVFGYLPGKETKDYETFFSLVLQLVSDTQGKEAKLTCKKLLCYFEKAIHKAAKNVFNIKSGLQVKVKGCFFHFSSALWKRVQKAGMVRQYADYKDVRKLVRSCVGLAHCPLSRIMKLTTILIINIILMILKLKNSKMNFLTMLTSIGYTMMILL